MSFSFFLSVFSNMQNLWNPDLSELSLQIANLNPSKIIVLVDENTHEQCLPHLIISIPELDGAEILEVPAGEESKTLEIAAELWMGLNDLEADRSSLLVNLGGGMITDLGGFVASTFRRGMNFIHIPTTLLAMVDAAIGGKTGVNLGPYKNHIGTFQNPVATIVSPVWLETLSQRQLLAGFAEVLKHALIADEEYWQSCSTVSEMTYQSLAPLLERSIEIKEKVIINDPFEKGERKALNFGHTIGHALESLSLKTSQPLLHGEAIGLGLIYETMISTQRGLLSEHESERILATLKMWYAHIDHERDCEKWWPLMLKDKKNRGQEVNCTLLQGIGKPFINQQLNKAELTSLLIE